MTVLTGGAYRCIRAITALTCFMGTRLATQAKKEFRDLRHIRQPLAIIVQTKG